MESKCPCCGGDRDSRFVAESFSCIDCVFMCETKDLPRIAAAMELARAAAWASEASAVTSAGVGKVAARMGMMKNSVAATDAEWDARQRVIKVFGGE